MEPANNNRVLVSLLHDISKERGISITSFCEDWVLCLETGEKRSFVFGYDFGLNSATAQMVANDKSATSEILAHAGIPAVEHKLFLTPQIASYVSSSGNWKAMLDYFHGNGQDVVCKANEGTGGRDVYRAQSILELESAVHRIFAKRRALCLSPFLHIAAEYRVYVLRGESHIIYSKERPIIVGDGCSTLLQLIFADPILSTAWAARGGVKKIDESLDLSKVPERGERVVLNWRHNLGQGGHPHLIPKTDRHAPALSALAVAAAKALEIDLAAVDIVDLSGALLVLEVNCGIMMESFAQTSLEYKDIAKRFYTTIVDALLG